METNSDQRKLIRFFESQNQNTDRNQFSTAGTNHTNKLGIMNIEIKTEPENNNDDNLVLRVIHILSNE